MNGHYEFQIGEFKCVAFSDGGLNYPVETFFRGISREQATQILAAHGLPTNHVYTPYTLLYVQTPSHNILIDTGLGRYSAAVQNIFPMVDNSSTNPGSFVKEFEVSIEVDMVLLTHAHADHVGGNINAQGELNFPKADYYIAQDEWDFWFSDERTVNVRPPQNVAIARECLQPIQDRVFRVPSDFELMPGIQFIPAPGHTPGQVAVLIRSGDEQLIHLSDAVLHPLHLQYPGLGVVFDYDPEQAHDSKVQLCNLAAANNMLVFAHHFAPFPNLGHIIKQFDSWLWQPLEGA